MAGSYLQRYLTRAVLYLLLLFGAAVFFLPSDGSVIASFKTAAELRATPTWWPETWTTANYPEVWSAEFARYFLNSFIYSGGSTLLVLFTSGLIGYVIVKDPSLLGEIIFWLMLAASMVPFVTYLLPLFNILLRIQQWNIPMVNTYWA